MWAQQALDAMHIKREVGAVGKLSPRHGCLAKATSEADSSDASIESSETF